MERSEGKGSDMAIKYKLVPLAGAAKKDSGEYRAVIENDGIVLGTEDVVKEACEQMRGIYPPSLVKSVFLGVLDSIRTNILKDGIRRRIDGYFSARLDLHGKFDGMDAPVDPSHGAAVTFETLGRYRNPDKVLKFSNVVPRRRVYVSALSSIYRQGEEPSLPEGVSVSDAVAWGLPMLIRGQGISPVCEGDSLMWDFTDESGNTHSGACNGLRDAAGHRPHAKEDYIYADWPEDLPRAAIGHTVRFTLATHAGNPDAALREVAHEVPVVAIK